MPELIADDGAHLHYEIHGSGPQNLILLHGMGGSSSVWGPVLAHLDPYIHRVLALDLRGHGKSRGGEARFTYPQLTADILAVANAVGMRQVVVVGQSGSSKNAVYMASVEPERVRGIVLVAPGGMDVVPLPREMLAWFFDYLGREGAIPPEFAPWFSEKIGAHRATVGREYAQTSRAALDASAELWVHTSIVEEAVRVPHPTLVIAGAWEPLYHPEFQRQTTLIHLPHARMEVLDCGHTIPLEEPVAVAELLTRFCASLA